MGGSSEKEKALTPKQARFVEEYLIDLNATQAAIRAGYSEKTAYSMGQRLLKNVEVQKAIAAAQSKRSDRVGVQAEDVLRELVRVGMSDLRKAFTADGKLRPLNELDDDTASAISSVKVVTRPSGEVDEHGNRAVEYVHEVKLWDKNSALEKIAKHLGMYVERVEHTSPDGTMTPAPAVAIYELPDNGRTKAD
ncbi:terminase small subunit [Rhodovulum sp. FJ3]|uniref:terminase small subunit n=1 Tax=Rhodovulum sp. FJ3 TaxID=3079053 RepID=UPI00293DA5F1|nr:terminase small subunit [Rhodovulum sp. FJ3]MDV4167802.1 terminase small subunit [Rhodovulum sp. FJ3]